MNIKKYLVLILLFLFGVFLLLQIDDPLDTEVLEWVESVDYETPNDSFYYLLGLNVAADQDPLEFGKAKVKEIRNWENQVKGEGYMGNTELYHLELSPEKFLIKSENEFLLNSNENYLEIFRTTKIKQTLDSEHRLFLSRVRHWLTLKPYSSMQWSFAGTIYPNYVDLLYGIKLHLNDLSSRFINGDEQFAVIELKKNIDQILLLMDNANSLIERLIFMVALNHCLDVYALMAQQNPSISSKLDIDMLRLTNLEKVVKGEMAFSFNSLEVNEKDQYYKIPSTENSYSDLLDDENLLPKWLGRTFYKPNITLNGNLQVYKQLLENSLLTPDRYYGLADSRCKKFDTRPLIAKIRNLGFFINYYDNSMCRFIDGYLARGYDLVAKIALINSIFDQKKRGFGQTINPATGKADSFYDEQKYRVCFKPHEKTDFAREKGFSCIYRLRPEV